MALTFKSATTDQITYESKKEPSPASAWLIAVGLLLVGFIFNRMDPTFSTTYLQILQVIFFCLSWLLFMVLIFQPAGFYLVSPASIVFDRVKGTMQLVSERGPSTKVIHIPLSEIKVVRLEEQEKGSTDNDRRVLYHLALEFHSGDQWYIASSYFRKTIDEQLEQLQRLVSSSSNAEATLHFASPASWQVVNQPGDVLATWSNSIKGRPWRSIARTLVYLAVLGGIIYLSMTRDTTKDTIVSFAILSPFAGLGAWLLVRGYRRLWRDAHTKFALRVHGGGLDYYEFEKEGGKQRKHAHFDVDKIEAIRYAYAPDRGLPHEIEIVQRGGNIFAVPTTLTAFERQEAVLWLRNELGMGKR